MASDYRRSHLHNDKGITYHSTFSNDPYRSMVWKFEKNILDCIIKSFYGSLEVKHLDFACGTGRVLRYLANYSKGQVGVDLSPSMLKVANQYNLNAEIIEADLTNNDVLGDRKFNLITAFRFFPNAQPDLRMQAMQVLNKHLANNGYIVFNNHKNTGSARNRLAVLFGHRNFKGMSIADVKALLKKNNLEIARIYSTSIFPSSESRLLLPICLLYPLEALLSKIGPLKNLGQNLIFVCRRPIDPKR